jgi:LysM repeat protein
VTLAEPGTAEPAGGSAPVYVVAQGQTIAAIAALVGVAAEDLAAYNGLAVDEELTEGTVLALPPGLEGER